MREGGPESWNWEFWQKIPSHPDDPVTGGTLLICFCRETCVIPPNNGLSLPPQLHEGVLYIPIPMVRRGVACVNIRARRTAANHNPRYHVRRPRPKLRTNENILSSSSFQKRAALSVFRPKR